MIRFFAFRTQRYNFNLKQQYLRKCSTCNFLTPYIILTFADLFVEFLKLPVAGF